VATVAAVVANSGHFILEMSVTCINLNSSNSDDETSSIASNSSDDESCPGPSKRCKTTGAAIYKTKFKCEWTKTWLFICEVPGNVYKFQCTICSRMVSYGHMGRADVELHISKKMHKVNVKSAHSQTKLSLH